MSLFIQQHYSHCDFSANESWIILSSIEQSIKRKIEAIGIPLKNWNIKINYGIKTGFNDAFIISTEKRNEILSKCINEEEKQRTAEIIRPILRGRDIQRYNYTWADKWLISTFPARHYDIDKFPAIRDFLLSYDTRRLEQTGKEYIINGEKIKARKKTNNKWFETQDSISYWEDLNQPKIVWGEISDRSKFAYDFNGEYVPEATSFLMVGEKLPYLLCVLNSPLAEWFFSKIGTTTGVGTIRWKKYTIQELLIPYPSNDLIETICSYVESYVSGLISIKELAEQANSKIYQITGLNPKEIKYVENFYPALL